jgi:iron complex outermembrane receptor protein
MTKHLHCMGTPRHFGLALLSGASLMVMAGVAHAQVPTDEILVTAQKRAESLQDVPISVGVVQGSFVQEMGVKNLEDISISTPSLTINQSPSQPGIYLRAIGSGTNNTGFEQSVGMFVDGIYMSKPRLLQQPLFDVERVEVIKGPQNVLFGKNTTAGALSISTANPTDEFEGLLSGLYGEDGEYQVDGMVSGPLAEGLGVRLAARASGMDGYLYNTFLGVDGPRIRDLTGRATVLYEPNENLSINLKGQFGRSRLDHGVPVIGLYSPALFQTLQGVDPDLSNDLDDKTRSTDAGGIPEGNEYLDIDTHMVALNIDYSIDDWTLTSISGIAGYKYDQANDSDYSANPNAQIALMTASKYSQWSQEFRIQSPVNRPFEVMAGAFYLDSDTKFEDWNPCFKYTFFPPAGGPVAACANLRSIQVQKTSSAFVRGTWNITDAFKLTGGVRYTHEKKNASGGLTVTQLDNVTPGVTPESLAGLAAFGYVPHMKIPQKRKENSWSPSVNVQYHMNENIMAYASFNKGHKSGGFNAIEGRGIQSAFEFEGEKARAFEFGAKTRYLDGRATTNIAVFFSRYSDLQVSNFNGLTFVVANAERANVNGVELDAAFRVTDHLSISGSATYLDAKYKLYTGGPCINLQTPAEGCVGGVQDLSGTKLQYAADWTGVVNVDYQRPIGGGLVGKLHVDVYYSDDVNLAPDNDPRSVQPSYAKINARVAIGGEDDKWEVAVIGRNLTDKITKAYENDLPGSNGSFQAHIYRGRSFAVQGTLKF